MNAILWLASYPKSGNTWLRAVLTNLANDRQEAMDINLIGGRIAAGRATIDHVLGAESSNLTLDEIERLRPEIYAQFARHSSEGLRIKIHDAFPYTSAGAPAISAGFSRGALYVIRNPLDLAASLASFYAFSLDRAIQLMADVNAWLEKPPNSITPQVPQRLGAWSEHVKSWVDQPHIPVLALHYEAMLLHPLDTFTQAAHFAGLPEDPARVEKAIRFSSFAELKRQEEERGFQERSAKAAVFFRKGKAGDWREELTLEQAQRIIADHGEVMRRFGYLDEQGNPTF